MRVFSVIWIFSVYLGLRLYPSLLTLLVVVCSYPLALLIQVSPSSTASSCHWQRMLSLFTFPASFGVTVPVILSAPSVFCAVSPFLNGILLFLISLSFAYLSGGFFIWGSLYPFQLSAICQGSIFLLHGFHIPRSLYLRFLFFRSSVFLSDDFIYPTSLSLGYHLRGFSAPAFPSVFSPQSPCAVLSFSSSVKFVGSPSLSTLFL